MFGYFLQQARSFQLIDRFGREAGGQGCELIPIHFKEFQCDLVAVIEDWVGLCPMRKQGKRRILQVMCQVILSISRRDKFSSSKMQIAGAQYLYVLRQI